MTLEKSNMKKMCSFCVSDWHIATTILPYVKEKTEKNEKIISIFKKGIENNIVELLKRMNIDANAKDKITKINWKSKDWERYEQFEYFMEENYTKDVNIIINGDSEYIKRINSYINEWINKNDIRFKQSNSNIKLINCYNISENLKQENILQQYEYILNTSGEKKIEDCFKQNNTQIKKVEIM